MQKNKFDDEEKIVTIQDKIEMIQDESVDVKEDEEKGCTSEKDKMIVDHLENNLSPEEKSKYVELGKGQKNKELRDENAEDDEGNSPNKKFATTTTEESDENSEKEVNENYAQEYLQYDTNKSIHILDNDCLTYIFQFLPIADKIRVESVCTRWENVIHDSWRLTKTLDLSLSVSSTSPNFSSEYTEQMKLCNKILQEYGKFFPNLKSVNISSIIFESSIKKLAENCTNIIEFNVGASTYEDIDEELEIFFERNQCLEYFAIHENNYVSGKSLLSLPQTIHTLILRNCLKIKANYLTRALRKLENLKRLVVDYCKCIEEDTFKITSKYCKNLIILELHLLAVLGNSNLFYLTHLTSLIDLSITNNFRISDEFLINLVHRCQQLTYINISDCTSVTDDGLRAIATLPKLERLVIDGLHLVTGDGLQNMCNLRELHCKKCVSIEDRDMSRIIESSPRLELLNLCGCRNLTRVTLEAAKKVCNSRSNNMILKILIGESSIFLKDEDEQSSPLLKIVNTDSHIDYYLTEYEDEYMNELPRD